MITDKHILVPTETPGPSGRATTTRPFTNVLVPTDLSEASERALEIGAEIARAFGAELTLLHVWSSLYSTYPEGSIAPLDEMERAARRLLEDVHARARKLAPKTDAVLRTGAEAAQILAVIEERGIDLVVMGTHARRGFARLVVGSVTDTIMRGSPVPVLTVGPRAWAHHAEGGQS
jgi:nucleotide-binding universal stress UspA family protein